MFYKQVLLPIIFAMSRDDPERAHEFVLRLFERTGAIGPALSLLSWYGRVSDPKLARNVFGLHLPNPVGLAAGFDKNACAVDALAALGFGWITVGTVTPQPQLGNPRPRIFRLPEHRALINRMGFNSEGAAAVAARLAGMRERGRVKIPIGVSLGKQKDTPVDDLAAVRDDYLAVLAAVLEFADYIEINFSSPNTAGLRQLSVDRGALHLVAGSVKDRAGGKPVLLKVSPDLSDAELVAVVEVAIELGLDGIIDGNTTTNRDAVAGLQHAEEAGGLSGKPLRDRTLARVAGTGRVAEGRIAVIACGGIESGYDVLMHQLAGAKAVQLYTSLVYQGPFVAREINRELSWHRSQM